MLKLCCVICAVAFAIAGCSWDSPSAPSNQAIAKNRKQNESVQGKVRVYAGSFVPGGAFSPNVVKPGISCSGGHGYRGGGEYRVYCDPYPDVCYQTSNDGSYIDITEGLTTVSGSSYYNEYITVH